MANRGNEIDLKPSHVLGIDRNSNTGIYMLPDNTVVYFAGKNIVKHSFDAESRDQRFLPYTNKNSGDIECVAVTANCTMMAYSLKLDASIIHIVDIANWAKKKQIALPNGFSPTVFSALAFSSNGKYLIAQGNTSDSFLFYFDATNGNLLGTHKVSNNTNSSQALNSIVNCISFHPNEPSQICCTGKGIFRQMTRSDKGFTVKQGSMTNRDNIDFKSHIWLPDGRIVVATSDGQISYIENASVNHPISIANTSASPVTNLTATPKGFICVSGGNKLHFLERQAERGYLEITNIRVDEKETICSVSIAQADDRVVVLLSDSRLISYPLTPGQDQQQTSEGPITLLPQYHIGTITSIDVAFRKQLIVTCGEDHSIRVWNYDKMQCEIFKFFSDQPLCVSFHPNGCVLVAGFQEKLRFLAITINDIVTHREFPIRGCREVKFSHGGQYFAAVNGNNVQIYSSYTFKNLVNLRSPGQRIRAIAWSTDDNVLVSCDNNGTITLHQIRGGKQKATSNQQPFHYISMVCADSVGTKCFGVTEPDNFLRETEDMATKNQLDVMATPMQLVMGPNNKCLFVSTKDGTVKIYKFPGSNANGVNFPSADSAVEIIAHHAPITSMCMSSDNNYLFTSGEDGCVYIMKISGGETQNVRSDTQIRYSEDVMITRSELVEQLCALKRAQQDVADLEKQQQQQLANTTSRFKQQRIARKEKYADEEKADLANIAELEKEIEAVNEEAKAQRQNLEMTFQEALQSKKTKFEMNIQNEKEQQEMLKKEIEETNVRGEQALKELQEKNKQNAEQIEIDFQNNLADLESQEKQIKKEKQQLKEEFNEWEVKMERELAFEIGKREFESQQKRAVEKEQTQILKEKSKQTEADLMKSKQAVETGMDSLKKQMQAVDDIKDRIRKAKQQKETLIRDIAERKKSIDENQIHIEDLTNQNQNLDKHRQLIRDRISEWKKQLEPMQAKQQDVSITHERMKQEMQRYQKNDEQLRLELNELHLKIDAKKAEIDTRTKELEEVKQMTKQFKLEVHGVYQKMLEDEVKEVKRRKMFAPALAALYRKYVGDEASSSSSQKKSKLADIQVERNRERDALERNITAIARRINRGNEEHSRQHSRMMEENVMLMTQISEIRRQNGKLAKNRRVIEESSKSTYSAEELNKIIEMQKGRIAQLTDQLKQLQLRGNVTRKNPVSHARLPPMNVTSPEPPKE
ncbi:hypothetical protein TRFO_10184 [Tritrichomonas foetus]|uniref:Uncharacterized protein n=1 Tax=Tritrichomonas foetus TaxID=1144522 RepID=A0A1J4JFL0_9EUKA|nr:hypothetical protein TRFO_10184 [Tritrichomonas foetus]|eukprot:OHS96012.1 hypothetical protein TRFO_10184 [Tritrichomonas foetus]